MIGIWKELAELAGFGNGVPEGMDGWPVRGEVCDCRAMGRNLMSTPLDDRLAAQALLAGATKQQAMAPKLAGWWATLPCAKIMATGIWQYERKR